MPGRLSESLLPGELNLEVTAKAGGFDERLCAELLCPERFVVACSAGHRFARRHAVSMREMGREVYLQRISFEYRGMLREHCEACGTNILRCCRSEREDWIQIMVAAGMGMCFLPEFPATQPGLVLRPIPGSGGAAGGLPGRSRRPALAPPLAGFVQAISRHPWPETAGTGPALAAEA